MKIVEKEFNVLTGKETITERDETKDEKLERETFETLNAERKAEAKTNALAKSALLAKLGITEDEAKLLLG